MTAPVECRYYGRDFTTAEITGRASVSRLAMAETIANIDPRYQYKIPAWPNGAPTRRTRQRLTTGCTQKAWGPLESPALVAWPGIYPLLNMTTLSRDAARPYLPIC